MARRGKIVAVSEANAHATKYNHTKLLHNNMSKNVHCLIKLYVVIIYNKATRHN